MISLKYNILLFIKKIYFNIFRIVRKFYCTIVTKMINKFPFHDSTLQEIGFINPEKKHSFSPDSGEFLFDLQ